MGMGRRSFDLFEQGVVGCEDTQIRGMLLCFSLCLTQLLYHNFNCPSLRFSPILLLALVTLVEL